MPSVFVTTHVREGRKKVVDTYLAFPYAELGCVAANERMDFCFSCESSSVLFGCR